jgi:chromosomal replication initiation ATPase DnaA
MKQLALPIAPAASFAEADFVADLSNEEARAWLGRVAAWPMRRLALIGPAGVGKTHLLRSAAAREGWTAMEGAMLRGLHGPLARGVALDDADAVPEPEALLHLINSCAEAGLPLLLSGHAPPARWHEWPADLRSRLAATAHAAIHPPGDELLAAIFQKQLADRQLGLEPGLRLWLLAQLPREAAAMGEAAARLDRASLAAGRRLTRATATAALGELLDDSFVEAEATTLRSSGGLL